MDVDGAAYLPVAPQLVAPHAVAVVQSERAVVGDGIKADFLSVHGVANPDVFSPAKGEDLRRERDARRSHQSAAAPSRSGSQGSPAHLPMVPAHLAPPLQAALHPHRTSGHKVFGLQTLAAADVTNLRDQSFKKRNSSLLSSEAVVPLPRLQREAPPAGSVWTGPRPPWS